MVGHVHQENHKCVAACEGMANCGQNAVLFTPPPIPTGLQDSSRIPTGVQQILNAIWILTKFEEYTNNCIHTNANYTELCRAVVTIHWGW